MRIEADRSRLTSFLRACVVLPALVLLGVVVAGCSITRHQTLVVDTDEELEGWTAYEVLWVERVTGERIEFSEEGGRLEASRNRDTRLVEYFVVGTDTTGGEHRLNLQDLALVHTRAKRDDPVAYFGVILLSATVAGGIILFSSFSLL